MVKKIIPKSNYQLKNEINNHEKTINIEEIMNRRTYTKEELLLLKLLLAQYAYLSGEKTLADQLLMEVEQTPHKGESVIKELENLKKNKKLYLQKSKTTKEYVFIKK